MVLFYSSLTNSFFLKFEFHWQIGILASSTKAETTDKYLSKSTDMSFFNLLILYTAEYLDTHEKTRLFRASFFTGSLLYVLPFLWLQTSYEQFPRLSVVVYHHFRLVPSGSDFKLEAV